MLMSLPSESLTSRLEQFENIVYKRLAALEELLPESLEGMEPAANFSFGSSSPEASKPEAAAACTPRQQSGAVQLPVGSSMPAEVCMVTPMAKLVQEQVAKSLNSSPNKSPSSLGDAGKVVVLKVEKQNPTDDLGLDAQRIDGQLSVESTVPGADL